MTITQQENNFSYSGNGKNTAARESSLWYMSLSSISSTSQLFANSLPPDIDSSVPADRHAHRVRGPFAVVGELQPLRLGGLIHLLTLVILDLRAENMEVFKADASLFNYSLKQTVKKVC